MSIRIVHPQDAELYDALSHEEEALRQMLSSASSDQFDVESDIDCFPSWEYDLSARESGRARSQQPHLVELVSNRFEFQRAFVVLIRHPRLLSDRESVARFNGAAYVPILAVGDEPREDWELERIVDRALREYWSIEPHRQRRSINDQSDWERTSDRQRETLDGDARQRFLDQLNDPDPEDDGIRT